MAGRPRLGVRLRWLGGGPEGALGVRLRWLGAGCGGWGAAAVVGGRGCGCGGWGAGPRLKPRVI